MIAGMAVYGDTGRGTSEWYTSAALSGVGHAALGAVAFGVLTPVTMLGMDLWDAHVRHTVAAPDTSTGSVVAALYIAVLAGSVALVPAVLLGGVLGAANGAVAMHPTGRSTWAALAVGLVAGVLVGVLVPPLVLGRDVLLWLRLLTGLVAGVACAAHLRHCVRRLTP
jgi:hypothetical protein